MQAAAGRSTGSAVCLGCCCPCPTSSMLLLTALLPKLALTCRRGVAQAARQKVRAELPWGHSEPDVSLPRTSM